MKKYLILALPVAILLVVGNGNSRSAFAQPKGQVLWQLNTDKDYQGPVQRSVVDSKQHCLFGPLSTSTSPGGRVEKLRKDRKEARLLAPGGDVYAWLCLIPWHAFFIRAFQYLWSKYCRT
jgi:hypothetical protein